MSPTDTNNYTRSQILASSFLFSLLQTIRSSILEEDFDYYKVRGIEILQFVEKLINISSLMALIYLMRQLMNFRLRQ